MKKIFSIFIAIQFCYVAQSQTFLDTITSIANNNQLAGGQLVVWCNNTVIEKVNFGKQQIANNIAFTDSSMARIASVSKTITAIAMMQCVENGLCSLDQDVNSILGFSLRNPAFPTQIITPRMLLSHKSSMIDGTGYTTFSTATLTGATVPSISSLFTTTGTYYTVDMFNTIQPGTYFNYANVNFGIIGTLVEKLTNKRFDIYVKDSILNPLEIKGSFLVQDIANLNNLAVLYRKSSNVWTPQLDDYGGVQPALGNITSYTIGSNAFRFAPQGGLRISASDLAKIFMMLMNKGMYNNKKILEASTVSAMIKNEWNDNGSNGNNYYGLFRSWGLGMQRGTNTANADVILANSNAMVGHAGEAYGLISDVYYDTIKKHGFAFYSTGSGIGYITNANSAFYTVEKEMFDAINNRLNGTNCLWPLSIKPTLHVADYFTIATLPNQIQIKANANANNKDYQIQLLSLDGREVYKSSNNFYQTNIETRSISNGIYLLQLEIDGKKLVEKVMVR
jgi:CubicO group peptidase (beta-lactamase class C family)